MPASFHFSDCCLTPLTPLLRTRPMPLGASSLEALPPHYLWQVLLIRSRTLKHSVVYTSHFIGTFVHLQLVIIHTQEGRSPIKAVRLADAGSSRRLHCQPSLPPFWSLWGRGVKLPVSSTHTASNSHNVVRVRETLQLGAKKCCSLQMLDQLAALWAR